MGAVCGEQSPESAELPAEMATIYGESPSGFERLVSAVGDECDTRVEKRASLFGPRYDDAVERVLHGQSIDCLRRASGALIMESAQTRQCHCCL
jgi:hypothetical protein